MTLAGLSLAGCGRGTGPLIFNGHVVDRDASLRMSSLPSGRLPYIIRFRGRVMPADVSMLESSGMVKEGYVPENGFIVLANRGDLLNLKDRLAGVWAYRPSFRVPPDFYDRLIASGPDATYDALVLGFRSVTGGTLVQDIESLEGTVVGTARSGDGPLAHVRAGAGSLLSLASSSDVRWIQPYPRFILLNDVASWIIGARMSASTVYENTNGYDGRGQAVAIADTGLDTGNAGLAYDPSEGRFYGTITDTGTGMPFHPAFLGKQVSVYAEGYPDVYSFADNVGHGTHVAGTLLGHDTVTPFAGMPHDGMAYGVDRFVFQAVMNRQGQFTGISFSIGKLFEQAYDDPLAPRIHSDSWGVSNINYYDILAWELDTFMWSHPDMLVLFAAGNDGMDADADGIVDPGSIETPALAKDCLTVGASESYRPTIKLTYGVAWPASFPAPPISTGRIADDPDGMAAFSSRGPASDGRIEPDLVAPGTFILSARSGSVFYSNGFEHGPGAFSISGTSQGFAIQKYGYESAQALGVTVVTAPVLSAAELFTPLSIASVSGRAELSFSVSSYLPDGVLSLECYDPSSGSWITMDTFTETTGWQGKDYDILSYLTDTSTDNLNGFGLRFTVSASDPADYVMLDDIAISTVTDGWGSASSWGITATSREDRRYVFLGGTSMATPVAAGGAAIVRQWLALRGMTAPSAALVKAVLINTAHDMYPGQYGIGKYLEVPGRPNNVEGWGRLDLRRLLSPPRGWYLHVFDYPTGRGMTTAGQRTLEFEVLDHELLMITLVWTDYPASPGASKAIVNQLEVSVTDPAGRTYYPNGMDQPDLTNNIQQIEIPDPETGIYRLTIKGHNVPQGVQPADDQPYALVVSGGVFRRPVEGRLYPNRGFSCSLAYGTSGSASCMYGMALLLLLPALLLVARYALARRRERGA